MLRNWIHKMHSWLHRQTQTDSITLPWLGDERKAVMHEDIDYPVSIIFHFQHFNST